MLGSSGQGHRRFYKMFVHACVTTKCSAHDKIITQQNVTTKWPWVKNKKWSEGPRAISCCDPAWPAKADYRVFCHNSTTKCSSDFSELTSNTEKPLQEAAHDPWLQHTRHDFIFGSQSISQIQHGTQHVFTLLVVEIVRVIFELQIELSLHFGAFLLRCFFQIEARNGGNRDLTLESPGATILAKTHGLLAWFHPRTNPFTYCYYIQLCPPAHCCCCRWGRYDDKTDHRHSLVTRKFVT